ncbi:2-dehydropantoate 2-reductase [Sedimentibacter hydroxybenzoicus DSM 7310]|uniref:2-dehydropantoate 2-reductase n=1 Tax=Sedimentibacter hydroxybenzoicus DSM 7310 TaxID=1123245 RepID=A0A974BMY3_SEDHY|nr:2-dehydropantoate 2-reductase [Sedimentibacter hydroxybenzoicus]NYB75851.1 2-dehydropantoate 2-reductase [Sedimentibacter hydroxybenzoicus DSM 7310]
MKTLILGAGAMGCLYGGLLKERGNDVILVDVSKPQVDEINKNGLALETAEGKRNIKIKAKFAQEVTEQPDLIILFTKTIHSKSALSSLKAIIGPETMVLSLQNGLGNDEVIKEFVPTDRIIIGTTNFPSDLLKPGNVRSLGKGTTKIMSCNGEVTEKLKQVEMMLSDAGFNCIITEDVFVSIWEKVAFNAACNALTAASRLKLGDVGKTDEGKELARSIAREVVSVANARNIHANAENVIKLIELDFVEHAEHMPSMMQDVLGNRTTEIDFINGAVVREAEKLGISVPVTNVLYKLVSMIQKNYENLIK